MDMSKTVIAGLVVGGLYLATQKGEAQEPPAEQPPEFALGPSTQTRAPTQQIDLTPHGVEPQAALGPVEQVTSSLQQDVQRSDGAPVVLSQTAFGRGELRYEQRVTATRLIERLKQGDQQVFKKPYTAKDVNVRQVLKVKGGNNVYDPGHPSMLNDAQQQRMTIELTDWDEYRFFSSLLAIGFVSANSEEAATKTYGWRLLEWFAYHRWYVGDGLKGKMLQAGDEASCRYKYNRGPGHKHRSYPVYWTQKTDKYGQTVDCGVTQGQDGYRKEYPAIDAWRKVRDGRYRLQDAQDFTKKIPLIHTFCHDQERKSAKEVMDRFAHRLGPDFWGISVSGQPQAGPCGAMVEYAAARYMQLSLCAMIDTKLGEAAGGALMGALQAAGGVALAALGAAIAGASAIPVAGWIAAGVTALVGAIGGAVGLANAIDNIRTIRQKTHDSLDRLLKAYGPQFGTPRVVFTQGIAGFSGHRLDLLIPHDKRRSYSTTARARPMHVESVTQYGYVVDDGGYWGEITDPLFSHYALSTTRVPAISVPQLPPHYLGIDFPLPIGVKHPDNTLMTLLPVCMSKSRCKEPGGQGAYHMKDGCPPCKREDGILRDDCMSDNETVVGYRDCAFEFAVYAKHLQTTSVEYAAAFETTQSALKPAQQAPSDVIHVNSPALQQPQSIDEPRDNGPLVLAAAVAGAALILSRRR